MAGIGTIGWVCIAVLLLLIVLGIIAAFVIYRYCKCQKAKAANVVNAHASVDGDEHSATTTPIFTAIRSRSLEKISKSRETMRPCEIFEKPPPTWNPPVSPSEELISIEVHPDGRTRPLKKQASMKQRNQKQLRQKELDVEPTQEDDHVLGVQSLRPLNSSQNTSKSTATKTSERMNCVSSPNLDTLPTIEKLTKKTNGLKIDNFWTPICDSFIQLKLVSNSDGPKLKAAFENMVNKPMRGRKATKLELQMILMGISDGFGILENMIEEAHEKIKTFAANPKAAHSAFFAHYVFVADYGKPLVQHLIKQTEQSGRTLLHTFSAPLLFVVALRRDLNLKLRVLAFAIMRKRLNELASHLPDGRLTSLPYPVCLMPDVKSANEAIFDVTESEVQKKHLPMDKTQIDSAEKP